MLRNIFKDLAFNFVDSLGIEGPSAKKLDRAREAAAQSGDITPLKDLFEEPGFYAAPALLARNLGIIIGYSNYKYGIPADDVVPLFGRQGTPLEHSRTAMAVGLHNRYGYDVPFIAAINAHEAGQPEYLNYLLSNKMISAASAKMVVQSGLPSSPATNARLLRYAETMKGSSPAHRAA
jgi:hypothetical protein